MTKARDLANLGNKTSLDEINDAYDAGALSNRNMFHNSEMKVAQRVSYPSTQPAVSYPGYYTVDRWYNHISGVNSRGVCTISQAQDAPTGFRNSLKIAVTTADTSLDAWAEYGINQRFEGQDLQRLCKGTSSAKEVTISFWVKSSLTGTYILEMLDDDNGSRHINKSYTINSANTWEYKSITFAGDTSGVLDNDNAKSMTVSWHLAGGSNFQGGGLQTSWGSLAQTKRQDGQVNFFANTGNTFQLTACQMEVGDTATPFEHRSYGDELAKCQRYTFVVKGDNSDATGFVGYSETTSAVRFGVRYPVAMRAAPSFTLSGTCRAQGGTTDTANFSSGLALVHPNNSHDGSCLRVTGTSGAGAADRGFNLQFTSDGASLTFDAEL
jgi:hypothetical protein